MAKITRKSLSKQGLHLEAVPKEIDLVCGMEISQKTENIVPFKERIYYFCSANCKEHFQNDPDKYVGD